MTRQLKTLLAVLSLGGCVMLAVFWVSGYGPRESIPLGNGRSIEINLSHRTFGVGYAHPAGVLMVGSAYRAIPEHVRTGRDLATIAPPVRR